MGTDDYFANIIANNFEEIQKNFKNGLNKIGFEYNEDLFIDVFLKCGETLGKRKLSKCEAIKYYWVSYLNALRKYKIKEKQFISTDDLSEDAEIYNSVYDEDVDILFNFIMSEIQSKFGEHITNAWKLHICQGKTYKDLINDGFSGVKFNYEFKRIMRYIRNDLSKKDKVFAELFAYLKENRSNN